MSTGYTPELAEEIVSEVQSGDILVAATDGLFDNLYRDMIEYIAKIGNYRGCWPSPYSSVLESYLLERTISQEQPWRLDFQRFNGGKTVQEYHRKGAVDVKQVLNKAFLNTESTGLSTACIIRLKNKFLHAVNLEDSRFLVIREVQKIVVKVEPKVVVVVAIDELFDNMWPYQIENAMNSCLEEDCPPELTAWTLVNLARQLYRLDDFISPFTQAAIDAGHILSCTWEASTMMLQ
ncbi:hypothetical protein ACH5RR_017929 [Cinchona calisaya]|uniref:Protein phosphatase n=1 Tax=Cinchona calisaya TaxID=153742 RepID=A0ABD2ZNL7_9GENT